MNLPHIPCIAHKLNLIVQQSLRLTKITNDNETTFDHADNNLKTILKKCRNIV